ncbi:MAG: hypothetical protein MUE75_00270 [Algoriphagus sp.]|jgi:hypothetical protein|nr:hypothetical protein [Algoriphagus sp.]
MKIKFLFLVFLGVLFLSTAAEAQVKVPGLDLSGQLLKILDNTSGLNLSGDQSTKLKADNKSFVDQLLKITNGSGSDDEKKKGILGLKEKRSNFLTSLLGQALAQKYLGNVTKGINPLKSKLGLAALAF